MALRAAEVWAALREAGVRLHDRGGALELVVPASRELEPLEALGRQAGAHLFPLASSAWQSELEGWPVALRDEWAERAALREVDGGQLREDAERAAFVEVRERALAPHALVLAALAAELGAVLVAIERDDGRAPMAPETRAPQNASPLHVRAASAAGPCRICGSRLSPDRRCTRCPVSPAEAPSRPVGGPATPKRGGT